MIKESGRIVAIEANYLWVETLRKSTCGSCAVQKGCGHGLLNKLGSGRSHHLRVLLGDLSAEDFSVNDQVDISIPEQILVTGALWVYLMPLMTMLAAALGISYWWPGDVMAFMGALSGLLIGFGLVKYHALKNRDNPRMQPVVASAKPAIVADTPLQLINPS